MTSKEEKMYDCETECPREGIKNDNICEECEVLCYHMDVKSVTCHEEHKDESFNKENIKKRLIAYLDTLPDDAWMKLNISIRYERPIQNIKKIYRGMSKLRIEELPL